MKPEAKVPHGGEKVLVTGAAGFIGSHVTRELLDRGHPVVALDDLSGGFRESVDTRATFALGSILDVELLERLFSEHGFTHVFHLAAYAAEGLSHFIKRFNYENNLIGSVNLINASINHQVRCFVFTSSIAVYGKASPPVREDFPLSPEDPYGIAKAAVEQELRVSRELFGLPHIIFRPHNVYGEGQNIGDRYRNVVGIFMNQILRGEPLSIFGDGSQTRAFSHIADVAPVIASSISKPGAVNQTFNIGATRSVSVRELGQLVSSAMGVPFTPRYQEERFEVQHIHAAHDKARELLGFEDTVSLEEGIARMAAWAKERGAQMPSRFGPLEIERHLPRAWQTRNDD